MQPAGQLPHTHGKISIIQVWFKHSVYSNIVASFSVPEMCEHCVNTARTATIEERMFSPRQSDLLTFWSHLKFGSFLEFVKLQNKDCFFLMTMSSGCFYLHQNFCTFHRWASLKWHILFIVWSSSRVFCLDAKSKYCCDGNHCCSAVAICFKWPFIC